MGFFDAIKSAVNMVTGGSATVTMEVGARTPNGDYPVRVKAVVASGDLKIGRVYLKVEGHETITYKHDDKPGTTTISSSEKHTQDANTAEIEVNIAPEQTLVATKEYSFEGTFRLPPDAQPTYTGKNAKHEWRVYAGLDATGTDPASSWVAFKYP